MGVSFKISKTGRRFRPKSHILQSDTNVVDDVSEKSKDSSRISSKNELSYSRKLEGKFAAESEDVNGVAGSSLSSEGLVTAENEVALTLNLFQDGYSIGKPPENEITLQSAKEDIAKSLHPYDRASENLLSTIESGRLPGDVLGDIPCKCVDGALLCEVRDYRNGASEQGSGASNGSPIVSKIRLTMSLENVVKDIPLISENSWSYGDMMEVESRILRALQPQLYLDPTPKLDRLCNNPVPVKLNLAQYSLRRKRLRQLQEATITSNKTHPKKVCTESLKGRSGDSGIFSGNMMLQNVHENMAAQNLGINDMTASRPKIFSQDACATSLPLVSQRYPVAVGTPRNMMDHVSSPVFNASGASPAGQDVITSHTDNLIPNATLHGKRENQDGQMSPLSSFNKRARPALVGLDGTRQHTLVAIHGSDSNWKNALLQQQSVARGLQYPNTGIQKFSQQLFEGGLNQDAMAIPFSAGHSGVRYAAKEEPFEAEKQEGSEFDRSKNDMQLVGTETSHLEPQQSRIQQRLQAHPFMRSNVPQPLWNNLGQHIEKDTRKDDQIVKRKTVQSPRLSGGALAQSPLSSRSGEFSSGSGGQHFGVTANNAVLGGSQKEKASIAPVLAVGGTPSLTSSANDSIQRQHQAQVAAKRRSNSLPKTPAMSGVASPASVSNMSVPLSTNSPPTGSASLAYQSLLESFSKIESVTARYQLNSKKNKVNGYSIGKPNVFPSQNLVAHLSNVSNNEDYKDDTSARKLSKSLAGGSLNTCKRRILNFILPERVVQGGAVSYVPRLRTRMILSEKPNDGTVAMLYGDVDDADFLAAEGYLPTLPNSHLADSLADQLSSLLAREGYNLVEDRVILKPTEMNLSTSNQPTAGLPPINSAVDLQQFAEAVSSQPLNEVAKPTFSGNASLTSSQNLLANTRMLPPGNPQAMQMSQGPLSGVSLSSSRPSQLDSQPSLQQPQLHQQQSLQQLQQQNQHSLIQQHHSQFQRSMMLAPNSLSQLNNAMGQTSNMQLGNNVVNKPSSLQLQLLQQQQQQQQQQPQLQRKMMMGLGTAVGMGNLSNNMVGLGGLGNGGMSVGNSRGIGGTGLSAPMVSLSGMGNAGQNQMNLGQTSNFSNAISPPLRPGTITTAHQAALMSKFRMSPNRPSILGGSQSSMASLPGATRQMLPSSAGLSMLGQALNRGNMSPLQRAMGPPRLMAGMNAAGMNAAGMNAAGMNLYMNQQQQFQLQQQMQQQQQLSQQQQQQQQETTSPLQAVVSPPQVGSPSTIGIPQMSQQTQQQQQQQTSSPQQMNQRTPMSPQMSSGTIHATSAGGNQEALPTSPQLSSQTLGSVGSNLNSPMDIQGVNKSNSVGNA